MRIYLIGFMGTGKSTLGKRIATTFQVPFLDTDVEVELLTGMTITEIFENKGEGYFRKLEKEVLQKTKQLPKAIIATGGGLPIYDDNMDWMKVNGITVYLESPEELLTNRILQSGFKRPLLMNLRKEKAKEKIHSLFTIRKPIYEEAAITLEMLGDEEEDYKLLEKACKYIW